MNETVSHRNAAAVHLLLSVLLLVSFGVWAIIGEPRPDIWSRRVFTIAVIVLLGLTIWELHRERSLRLNLWAFCCCLYGLLIALVALVHFSALAPLPESFVLNVDGLTAQQWVRRNWQFMILYLCFPILCLLQHWFLKRLRLRSVVRILIGIMLLSSFCVVLSRLFPTVVDPRSFMGGRRFQGFASSPNAYAFLVFLLLPWISFCLLGEFKKGEKLAALGCLLLALWGVIESGARTASVMIVLFLLATPIIAAYVRPQKRKRTSWLRLSIPLVVAIALGVSTFAVFHTGNRQSYGKLGPRVREIGTRIEDHGLSGILFKREARGFHAMVAGAMLFRAPLAGWGPGGFYREFPNATFLATGQIRPTKDSALNHYLMIGGDLGAPLLAVNLLLIGIPLWVGFRSLKRNGALQDLLVIRLVLLGNTLFLLGIAFMPPSYFPEVLWLWTAQLAALVVLGEKVGVSFTDVGRARFKRISLAGGVLVVLVLLGAVSVSHGTLGYSGRHERDWWPWRYTESCYNIEQWFEGTGCWCKDNAVLQFPYFNVPPETLKIRIAANYTDMVQNPVTLRYGGTAGFQDSVTFRSRAWKSLSIPITDANIYSPTQSQERRHWRLPWLPPTAKTVAPVDIWYVVLRLQTSRPWEPKDQGIRRDPRELALRVLLPDARFEKGCYPPERWHDRDVVWCREDVVLQVPFSGLPPPSLDLRVHASHPDIQGNPVVLRFGTLSAQPDSVIISDHSWHTITVPITPDHIVSTEKTRNDLWWRLLGIPKPKTMPETRRRRNKQHIVLALRPSRVWIPKEWGTSQDPRELGIAVVVPQIDDATGIDSLTSEFERTEARYRAYQRMSSSGTPGERLPDGAEP